LLSQAAPETIAVPMADLESTSTSSRKRRLAHGDRSSARRGGNSPAGCWYSSLSRQSSKHDCDTRREQEFCSECGNAAAILVVIFGQLRQLSTHQGVFLQVPSARASAALISHLTSPRPPRPSYLSVSLSAVLFPPRPSLLRGICIGILRHSIGDQSAHHVIIHKRLVYD
jgi:hypothetical protein